MDLVGDILKDTCYKETQVNRLKRYGIKKVSGERSERSAPYTELPHSSSLASASPHSYSSPDINTTVEENPSFSQFLKKPRLDDYAIDKVLNSLYGSGGDE